MLRDVLFGHDLSAPLVNPRVPDIELVKGKPAHSACDQSSYPPSTQTLLVYPAINREISDQCAGPNAGCPRGYSLKDRCTVTRCEPIGKGAFAHVQQPIERRTTLKALAGDGPPNSCSIALRHRAVDCTQFPLRSSGAL